MSLIWTRPFWVGKASVHLGNETCQRLFQVTVLVNTILKFEKKALSHVKKKKNLRFVDNKNFLSPTHHIRSVLTKKLFHPSTFNAKPKRKKEVMFFHKMAKKRPYVWKRSGGKGDFWHLHPFKTAKNSFFELTLDPVRSPDRPLAACQAQGRPTPRT